MIFLYGVFFISTGIFGITLSDISLFLLLGRSILSDCKFKIKINKYDIFLLIFIIASLMPGLIYSSESYFDNEAFILSYGKFIIYCIAIIFIPQMLYKDKNKTDKILINSLKYISIFSVIQFISYYTIPQIDILYNQYATTYGVFRISSIFSEPSLLFYPLVIYFYLITSKVKINRLTHSLIFCQTLLSLSLTVYIVYISGIALIYIDKSKLKKLKIIPVLIVIFYILYNSVPIIQVHINNLITLNPSSATTRLLGGFEYAINAPFCGVGLGNVENYYHYNLNEMNLRFLTTRGTVNNIIAVVKVFSGYIGVISFILFIFSKYYKKCKVLLKVIVISFFSWGNFNTAGFFFMVILLEIQRLKFIDKEKGYEIK
ncbi:MAG: hypothetical protein E6370_11940 [Clostridiales bacterium]|nr:hypothetical protein [Clostridiales bacterium]MDU6975020.1 hypothetical protein [Clostridiales bacterium]